MSYLVCLADHTLKITPSPIIGGAFAEPATEYPSWFNNAFFRAYPYVLPCIVTFVISILAALLTIYYVREVSSSYAAIVVELLTSCLDASAQGGWPKHSETFGGPRGYTAWFVSNAYSCREATELQEPDCTPRHPCTVRIAMDAWVYRGLLQPCICPVRLYPNRRRGARHERRLFYAEFATPVDIVISCSLERSPQPFPSWAPFPLG